MSRLEAYAVIEHLGPVVSTAEAAAALRRSSSSTSRVLRGLEEAGRVRRIRSGLWAVGPAEPDPFTIVAELTAPHPAYVSFLSALNFHGAIDQIPREFSVASLDRARRIRTSIGTFAIHHLPVELYGGWSATKRGRVASPAKAIFDLCYVSAASAGRARSIPELDLPADLDRSEIDRWLKRIESPRLATITRRGVAKALARAVR